MIRNDNKISVALTPEQVQFLRDRSAGAFFAAAEALLVQPLSESAVPELNKIRQLWGAINVAAQDSLAEWQDNDASARNERGAVEFPR